MDRDYRTNMPDELHDFARGAQRDLGAVADRMILLRPGDEVVAGMRALDTAGHTPGHLSFELSGSEGLIITADAATNQIVSFEHPEWRFGYDTLPDVAIRNRVRLSIERRRTGSSCWAITGAIRGSATSKGIVAERFFPRRQKARVREPRPKHDASQRTAQSG